MDLGLARFKSVLRMMEQRIPRIASFADQGFQGVANVLASALLARAFTHGDFAIIGMMIGAHYFGWGMHRSLVVLPFILDASDRKSQPDIMDAWWWINVLVCLLLGAGLYCVALLGAQISSPNWIAKSLRYAAFVSPVICTLEFIRRRLYQADRPVAAACCSALYAVLLTVMAAGILFFKGELIFGALAWTIGAAAGVVGGLILVPPRLVPISRIIDVWRGHWRFAIWMALTSIPFAIYTTAVVLLVGVFGGATAAAGFTAARTLTNPAMAAVAAVDTLDKPRAARALAIDGRPGLRGSIARTRRTVWLLTTPYLLAVAVLSPFLLVLAFGEDYRLYALGVSLMAGGFFCSGLTQPSETALIVLRASRPMLAIRTLTAILTVAGLWAFGGRYGFVGCAAVFLTTNLINMTALGFAERRASA